VSCEAGDVDVDEKRTIDKASPSRFESKIRIWELAPPQTDGIMVDVLETGKVAGGSLDMLESSQKKGKRSLSPHAIRFYDPATLRATPARVAPGFRYFSYTDHERMKLETGLYFDSWERYHIYGGGSIGRVFSVWRRAIAVEGWD
jgi:hypothetical protein